MTHGNDLPSGGGILRLQIKCLCPVESAAECHESHFHVVSADYTTVDERGTVRMSAFATQAGLICETAFARRVVFPERIRRFFRGVVIGAMFLWYNS